MDVMCLQDLMILMDLNDLFDRLVRVANTALITRWCFDDKSKFALCPLIGSIKSRRCFKLSETMLLLR